MNFNVNACMHGYIQQTDRQAIIHVGIQAYMHTNLQSTNNLTTKQYITLHSIAIHCMAAIHRPIHPCTLNHMHTSRLTNRPTARPTDRRRTDRHLHSQPASHQADRQAGWQASGMHVCMKMIHMLTNSTAVGTLQPLP